MTQSIFTVSNVQNNTCTEHVYNVACPTANSELGNKFRPYICSSLMVVKLVKDTLAIMEPVGSFLLFSKFCDFSLS